MAEPQIDDEAFFMLMQDDFAAFLSDTSGSSDASVVDALNMADCAASDSLPLEQCQRFDASAEAMPSKTNRVSRVRQHQRLKEARDEVALLQHQLKIEHEKHELRVFLDQVMNRSSGDSFERSKFRALRERRHRQQAEERNARLRQQIATNATVQEQVMALVRKQRSLMPRAMCTTSLRLNCLVDHGAQVFQSLRARLDARYSQLDSILSRVPSSSRSLNGRRKLAPWSVSASDRGISVDFSESFVMPFSLEMILSVVGRHTSLRGLEVCAGNYVDKITQTPMSSHLYPRDKLTSARESERKVITRRVNDARGVLLLWEGSSVWQANENRQAPSDSCLGVQSSGWALVTRLEPEVSVAHYGCSMRIHSVGDDSCLDLSNVLVNCVVQSMRLLNQSRASYLENVLLDELLERAGRC